MRDSTVIITEVRVYKIKGGYYADPSFAKVIERYNGSFSNICLVTRIISENKHRNGYIDISSRCRKIYNIKSIPFFFFRRMDSELKKILDEAQFVIFRVPSLVSIKTCKYISRNKKKYLVEVMGCAWDAYWNHGLVGKIVAPYIFVNMRKVIGKANYAVYVTQEFLQKRYPCRGKTIGVSNVEISLIDGPKDYNNFNKKSFTMMTAGAVNVKYKGQEYVIKAISELRKKDGVNIKYYLAGKGDNSRLCRIAKRRNVSENIVFLGMLSKEELANLMRSTDIYIQPSLQEGLPRSLIEAMSHGCVCLGAKTAGIPELLQNGQLFNRKSSKAIINSIQANLGRDLNIISRENTQVAKKYRKESLDKIRKNFYNEIILDQKG